MAAMMVLMVVLLALGPHHGFMGSRDVRAPHADAPYVQTDRTENSDEDKP